jgi:hypothetical protein
MTAWQETMFRAMRWREAIASVALSHGPNCTCDVCKASMGDEDAFTRIAAVLAVADDARQEP